MRVMVTLDHVRAIRFEHGGLLVRFEGGGEQYINPHDGLSIIVEAENAIVRAHHQASNIPTAEVRRLSTEDAPSVP